MEHQRLWVSRVLGWSTIGFVFNGYACPTRVSKVASWMFLVSSVIVSLKKDRQQVRKTNIGRSYTAGFDLDIKNIQTSCP